MYTLASDIYARGFGAGYDYDTRPVARHISSRDRCYDALSEARAVNSEMLAQAADRREEEVLERRLHELRRSRPAPFHTSDFASCRHQPRNNWVSDNRLEVLNLQVVEEEQMARLEALRQRRRRLEEEERIKAAVELRHESEEFARREKARQFRELAIAEEEDKLRRLIQAQRTVKVPIRQPYSHPVSNHDLQVPNAFHHHQQPATKPVCPHVQRFFAYQRVSS
jgi:hypothetical protein